MYINHPKNKYGQLFTTLNVTATLVYKGQFSNSHYSGLIMVNSIVKNDGTGCPNA